jgi:hypothetical protein
MTALSSLLLNVAIHALRLLPKEHGAQLVLPAPHLTPPRPVRRTVA